MPATNTITVGNTRLDNYRCKINGTDIGALQGGSEVTVETSQAVLTVDQYGSTPMNVKNTGDRVTLKLVFLEVSYANLAKALFGGTLRTVGGNAVGVGGNFAGTLDGITRAVPIELHPDDQNDGTTTFDINIWKAVPTGPVKWGAGPDKYTQIEVEFMALLDTSKTVGKQLIDFGNPSAT